MKNPYLEKVESFINNKSAKKQILAELQYHIEDKTEYYADIGYSREEAEGKAIEEMGEPEQVAVSLNALHSAKWYKTPRKIIFAVLWVELLFVVCDFGYVMNYSNTNYSLNHSIYRDVLSLAVFIVLSVFLFSAYKKKDKGIAVCVIVLCVCIFVLPFIISTFADKLLSSSPYDSMFSQISREVMIMLQSIKGVFEPMWYAAIILVTKGASGYCDSVLRTEFICDSIKPWIGFASYFTVAFFLIWALIIYISIKRYEKTKPSNIKPIQRIFVISSSFICTALAAIMLVGSVFALTRVPIDKSKVYTMLDFVADCSEAEDSDHFKMAQSRGFKLELTDDSNEIAMIYSYDLYNCSLTYLADDTGEYIEYYVNIFAHPDVISEESISVDKKLIDKLLIGKTTINDFKKIDYYYKASSVQFSTETGELSYQYRVNNDIMELTFKNGILEDIYDTDTFGE